MSERLVRPSLDGYEVGGCRLVRRLSSNGRGAVYLARQHHLGDRFVAVKIIALDDASFGPHHEPLSSIEQRFVREGKLLGHLTHPHILPVHDAGAEGDLLYLVMPYMPDGSLMDALRGQGPHVLSLPVALPFALDLLQQVASALQYIHERGIVHRDVKPSNLLLHVEDEGHWHVMLADFGIARAADSTAQQHLLAGTFAYMAPEQFQGLFSPASDQYALAVVAYLLVTGRLPFPGNGAAQIHGHLHETPASPRAFNPALPPPVGEAILRALAKQPQARYPSVAAFMAALRAGALSDAEQTVAGRSAGFSPLVPISPAPISPAPPVQSDEAAANAASPFAVTPVDAETQAADPAFPIIISPQGQVFRGARGRTTAEMTETTEAAGTPHAHSTPRAPGAHTPADSPPMRPGPLHRGTTRRSRMPRNRKIAVLLGCLLMGLIAILVDLGMHGWGRTVSGANQPPYRSSSGGAPAPATAAVPVGTPASQSGPGAPATATTSPASGSGSGLPGGVPPATPSGATLLPSVPTNAAQIIGQPAPATARVGQRYTVTATIANTGTSTWHDGGDYGLLCDTIHHPQSTCVAGTIIPFSNYTVAPGQRVPFAITMVALPTPGVYESWWTLEQHGIAFGGQDVRVRVTVSPPAPTSTPAPPPAPTPSPSPVPSPSPSPVPSPSPSPTANSTPAPAPSLLPPPPLPASSSALSH